MGKQCTRLPVFCTPCAAPTILNRNRSPPDYFPFQRDIIPQRREILGESPNKFTFFENSRPSTKGHLRRIDPGPGELRKFPFYTTFVYLIHFSFENTLFQNLFSTFFHEFPIETFPEQIRANQLLHPHSPSSPSGNDPQNDVNCGSAPRVFVL